MKITTKFGDNGESGLCDGQRRSKTDPVFDALGDMDELNAALGMCRVACEDDVRGANILRIQKDLYRIMAFLGNCMKDEKGCVGAEEIEFLDNLIEAGQQNIDLHEFVIPGENELSARFHVARATCRRAERKLVGVLGTNPCRSPKVLKYMNRLSDLLFIFSF